MLLLYVEFNIYTTRSFGDNCVLNLLCPSEPFHSVSNISAYFRKTLIKRYLPTVNGMDHVADPRNPDRSLELIHGHGAFGCTAITEFLWPITHQSTTILYRAHFENGIYVIKQMRTEPDDFEKLKKKMPELLKLVHENIAKYFGLAAVAGADNGKILARTALQYYPGRTATMWRAANAHSPVHRETIRQILSQLLEGLHHLHTSGGNTEIIHCDIKTDNLIVLETNNTAPVIRIIDLETAAVRVSEQMQVSSEDFTCSYAAPEQLQDPMGPYAAVEGLSVKSDIWSFGCVAIQLCTGDQPSICRWNAVESEYGDELEPTSWTAVFNVGSRSAKPDLRKLDAANSNHLLVELIGSCLSFATKDRPTAAELLLHGYFTSPF